MIVPIPPDLTSKAFGPLAEQFGLSIGEWGKLLTAWSNRNVARILDRWNEQRGDKPAPTIKQIEATLPTLRLASAVSDDELQKRWAALLESTVSNPDDTLPSFGQTLSQMNADEARFLDRLLPAFGEKTQGDPFTGQSIGEMGYEEMLATYDKTLALPQVSPFELNTPEDDRDPQLMSRASLVIDDLVRLGIVGMRFDATSASDHDTGDVSTMMFRWFSLSFYGRNFMCAVTSESKRQDPEDAIQNQ